MRFSSSAQYKLHRPMSPLHFLFRKIFERSSIFWRKVTLNIGQLHCTGVAFVSQPSRPFQNFYAIWLALTGDNIPSPCCSTCSAAHSSACHHGCPRLQAWSLTSFSLSTRRPCQSTQRRAVASPLHTAPPLQSSAEHSTECWRTRSNLLCLP